MKVVVLAGGVGGAKLADGFAQVLSPEALTIVVNTGDDFTHLGLKICPDLDTVMYTLAGQDNEVTGWGRSGESWRVIEEVGHRGGPDWFKLGDLDLATHLVRSDLLQQGASLTTVTRQLCSSLGVKTEILPMSDQVAPTMIRSGDDTLSFQEWFVHMKWQPKVDEVLLPDNVNCSREVASAKRYRRRRRRIHRPLEPICQRRSDPECIPSASDAGRSPSAGCGRVADRCRTGH